VKQILLKGKLLSYRLSTLPQQSSENLIYFGVPAQKSARSQRRSSLLFGGGGGDAGSFTR
jgi:hypothetical protein